jgi:HD-like signal output (HDOD) protein
VVRVAHRQLSKPCDPDELRTTVQRIFALRELLGRADLLSLLSQLESVPSMPEMYTAVVEELESAEPSLQRVGEIIARDVGMSAKILQLIRSAYFGVRFPVSSPGQAVVYLGEETTRVLVLATNIFSQFNPALLQPLGIDVLWSHSQLTSRLAGIVAEAESCDHRAVECAVMAGMLHDTGKVILAGYLPARYRQALTLARERGLPSWEAEKEVFGTTHAEVGAGVLGLWGLPEMIVEAIAWHHHPDHCPGNAFTTLTAVHVADALAHQGRVDHVEPDEVYLEHLGRANRLAVWRELGDTALCEATEP